MNDRKTILSPCRTYRYTLWREFDGATNKDYAMFIGLNPSTADEIENDHKITRCIRYAKDWGYGALCMVNLFAFRATDPNDMLAASDPVGPDNDAQLVGLARGAGVIVAAWGVDGTHLGRDQIVRAMIPSLHCLIKTKDGHPGHPARLRKDLVPIPY